MPNVWKMESGENGPYFEFAMDGEPFEGRHDNAHLYTHAFEHRGVDHLYFTKESEELRPDGTPRMIGRLVFRALVTEFDQLARLLHAHDFFHIHAPYPNEHDKQIYEEFVEQELADIESTPDWLS